MYVRVNHTCYSCLGFNRRTWSRVGAMIMKILAAISFSRDCKNDHTSVKMSSSLLT